MTILTNIHEKKTRQTIIVDGTIHARRLQLSRSKYIAGKEAIIHGVVLARSRDERGLLRKRLEEYLLEIVKLVNIYIYI